MQKNILLLILLTIADLTLAYSQTWNLLSNSPNSNIRHDDLFFTHADTGWVVNVDGNIYKTTNGGTTWITQLYQPKTSFRCVGFINSQKGWAGNLGPGSWNPTSDTLPLYQTTDGGSTWLPVTNISGPLPKGICGINVVNDSVIYAVGRVGGPTYIMKTINAGENWTSVPAPSPILYLIDCHFFSPDTGIAAGCTGSAGAEKYALFYTSNGGQDWQLAHESTGMIGTCWKISFPSRMIGYASVEAFGDVDSIPILKTADGGLTWNEKLFSIPNAWNQGIGFINDSTGWCGSGNVKETIDGGSTWTNTSFIPVFNRFRKINDTIAYASGRRIWKYSNEIILGNNSINPVLGISLDQNYPNPFSSSTTIKYHLPKSGLVILKVYDWTGRPVKTLVNQWQKEGSHEAELALNYFYESWFYYTLSFENEFLTGKALMLKK